MADFPAFPVAGLVDVGINGDAFLPEVIRAFAQAYSTAGGLTLAASTGLADRSDVFALAGARVVNLHEAPR